MHACGFLIRAAILASLPVYAGQTVKDLTELSIEELLNIKVTSVARKPQSLRTAAAAVFVITSEDIRRSGLHSLPEVLRLAPGVQVARIETGIWGISIRGFNEDFAKKLLVLVDGRRVYAEVSSGVYWSMQEMPLDDIDRIEVIRGPGAAMWGVNAFNGVINIITKPAGDTQGAFLSTEAGTEMETNNRLRYGGRMGSKASYRMGARESGHEHLSSAAGAVSAYGWNTASMDFRIDWDPTSRDSIAFSGQGYHSELGHTLFLPSASNPFPPFRDVGEKSWSGDLQANWQRRLSDGSSIEARFSWDRTEYGDANVPVHINDIELEVEHRLKLGSRQDFVWGASFRDGKYDVVPQQTFRIVPPHTDADIYSFFAQDQIALVRDRLYLILGVQTGHHYAVGFEVQPTGRLLWTPTTKLTSWAAVSRAVRTPSAGELGFDALVASIPLQPPLFGLVHVLGTPGLRPETMLAYEAGQRVQLGPTVSLDVSVFYNVHQHLIGRNTGSPFFVPPRPNELPHLDLPVQFENALQGVSYGSELSASWAPAERWRVMAGYSWLRTQTRAYPGMTINDPADTGGTSPQQQWELRSHLDLTKRLDLDTALYFYGAMPAIGVPRYLRGDLRLGWRPKEKVEFSAGVQNAFDPSHLEFFSTRLRESLNVPRNVYGALAWRF